MSSWRDQTSQEVQDDLDSLLNESLAPALDMVSRRGEFFPFTVTLSASGQTDLVMADPGLGERPPSQQVLDLLYAGARHERDRFRGVAFVADVRVDDGDAVRVELEHRHGGPALACSQPYRRRRLRRDVQLGEPYVADSHRRTWPD